MARLLVLIRMLPLILAVRLRVMRRHRRILCKWRQARRTSRRVRLGITTTITVEAPRRRSTPQRKLPLRRVVMYRQRHSSTQKVQGPG